MRKIFISAYTLEELEAAAPAGFKKALEDIRDSELTNEKEYLFDAYWNLKDFIERSEFTEYKQIEEYCRKKGETTYLDLLACMGKYHGRRLSRYVSEALHAAAQKVESTIEDYFYSDSAKEFLIDIANTNDYEYTAAGELI